MKIANGTPGEAPEPGDVISFSDGGEGHVVVVASSDVNSFGNGSITVMSQNDTTDGWRTLGSLAGRSRASTSSPRPPGFTIRSGGVIRMRRRRSRAHAFRRRRRGFSTTPIFRRSEGPVLTAGLSSREHFRPGITLDHATGDPRGGPDIEVGGAVRSQGRRPRPVQARSCRVALVVSKAHPPPLDAADFDDDLAVG